MQAQVLRGEWVDTSEASIEEHRKTDVTVIVLDHEDRAVQNATVRLEQRRHDFVLGLTLPSDRLPPAGLRGLPVYRCFNAMALDRLTDWSKPTNATGPTPQRLAETWRTAIDPIAIEYGRVLSADPARNADKLARLNSMDLHDAALARVDFAVSASPQATGYDLYADLINQDMLERKLGSGILHRVFERARAKQREAVLGLRVRDAIALQRGRALSLAVQRFEVLQVPFDRVTIEQRFNRQVQPLPLRRMIDDHVAKLPVPVTLAGLEVGGSSDVAAALNTETLLRVAFAEPNITGLYFAGLYDDEVYEPHAQLLNDEHEPTAVGQVIDSLFFKHWRTDMTLDTDERGNANARVFTGWYTITATLPDGRTIRSDAYIPKDDRRKLVVLQQTRAEAGDE